MWGPLTGLKQTIRIFFFKKSYAVRFIQRVLYNFWEYIRLFLIFSFFSYFLVNEILQSVFRYFLEKWTLKRSPAKLNIGAIPGYFRNVIRVLRVGPGILIEYRFYFRKIND